MDAKTKMDAKTSTDAFGWIKTKMDAKTSVDTFGCGKACAVSTVQGTFLGIVKARSGGEVLLANAVRASQKPLFDAESEICDLASLISSAENKRFEVFPELLLIGVLHMVVLPMDSTSKVQARTMGYQILNQSANNHDECE